MSSLEQLWAPWRFEYIQRADESNKDRCLFCSIAESDQDQDHLVIKRGASSFVLLNAFPYTSGHLMVAPYAHKGDLEGLDDGQLLEIHQLVQWGCRRLRSVYDPKGFNVGLNMGQASGAGIPDHVHWHVVPRWTGDTNFMTTVAGARVLPQSLSDTWSILTSQE
ncbi:MAG: HIT domain-containing protein [Chthonomonadaceae bacterium]|nr:HIT domain-containing protein [Chthonomonadaceae bacterium]